jgi:hypothetical protein
VVIPKPFANAVPLKRVVFEEVARPLHPSEADELGCFFKERVRAREMAAWVPDARFAEARRRFNSPRFRMLHRALAAVRRERAVGCVVDDPGRAARTRLGPRGVRPPVAAVPASLALWFGVA